MPRPILDESALHPAIRAKVAGLHADLLAQVQTAVATHPVVVLGMAGNPFVGKARKLLGDAGLAHEYIGIGSYFSEWRRRRPQAPDRLGRATKAARRLIRPFVRRRPSACLFCWAVCP